jgi:hypothetical protein
MLRTVHFRMYPLPQCGQAGVPVTAVEAKLAYSWTFLGAPLASSLAVTVSAALMYLHTLSWQVCVGSITHTPTSFGSSREWCVKNVTCFFGSSDLVGFRT